MVCLSRPYPFKFLKGCPRKNLLSPLLNTLPQIIQHNLLIPSKIFSMVLLIYHVENSAIIRIATFWIGYIFFIFFHVRLKHVNRLLSALHRMTFHKCNIYVFYNRKQLLNYKLHIVFLFYLFSTIICIM